MNPLRIGAVSFLNTVPLIEGLDADREVFLLRDLPARLADLLYEQRIEVGLLPIVEYLRGIGGDIVPGICIASHGAVRTVKVFSKQPIQDAEAIAVDRGSRSSVALLRILLAEMYDRHPDLHIVEPRPEQLFLHHDTVLVIGDRAESVRADEVEHVYDLGSMWQELTGLPFVFAAWVMRAELSQDAHHDRREEVIHRLSAAKSAGLERLETLAAQHAPRSGKSEASLLDYWRQSIGYDLGEAELAGLRRFAELASRYNLCSARSEVSVANSVAG